MRPQANPGPDETVDAEPVCSDIGLTPLMRDAEEESTQDSNCLDTVVNCTHIDCSDIEPSTEPQFCKTVDCEEEPEPSTGGRRLEVSLF